MRALEVLRQPMEQPRPALAGLPGQLPTGGGPESMPAFLVTTGYSS